MLDTETSTDMNETEFYPAEFIRSGRITHRVSLQPSASSAPLNSPRTASSIYSRSVQNQADGGAIASITDDKETERLDGVVHPAMRHNRQSTSSLTSIGAMLRRMPSGSEDHDHDHDHRQQDHYQENQTTSRPSVGGSSGEVRRLHLPPANNDEEAEQQGPVPSAATQFVRKRRICTVSRLAFSVVSLVIVVILALCVCIAVGVFGKGESAPSVPGEAVTTTSSASPSPSPETVVTTRDLDSSTSDEDVISSTSSTSSSSSSSSKSTPVITETSISPGWTTTVKLLSNTWFSHHGEGDVPTAKDAAGEMDRGVPATAVNLVPPIRPTSKVTQTVTRQPQE